MAGALATYPLIVSALIYEVLAAGTYSERSTSLLAANQLWLMVIFNVATGLRAQAARRRVIEGERQALAALQARKVEREREALRNSLIAALADAVERPLALVQQSRQALSAASAADGGLGPREEARLSTLNSAADRLSLLLELAAERDGGGNLPLQRDRLSLEELIFQTRLLLPEAERERIHQALPDQDFLFFRGDARLLSFALLNGLENAIRYSPRGSAVHLTVYAETRGEVAGYGLSLQNDGVPLSDEACEGLFEKYARAQGQGQPGGLGLGLFLVRRIVESHGGSVAFRAGLSEGVELLLWLPKGAP
jgi:two-component system sensor histidine kinase KdpD